MGNYSSYLLTYFDILGFRHLIDTRDPDVVADILRTLNREAAVDNKITDRLEKKFINFSDTFLRTTHLLSQENVTFPQGLLFFELLDVVYIQHALIYKGVLLRGSVTVGELRVRDNLIFGPALNKAYFLEKELAVYPRVIVDPVIFDTFKKNQLLRHIYHNYQTDKNHVRALLQCDTDGIYYIDYLRAIESELDNPKDYLEFLRIHRELIAQNVLSKRASDRISVKFHWLAHYHNVVIAGLDKKTLKKYGYSPAKLCVKIRQF